MWVRIMEVQAPTSTTIGYLLMLDAETTDYEELTTIVQESKCFTHLPIRIKPQELPLTKAHKKKDWKDPDRLDVVTVMCSANKTKATTQSCKKYSIAQHPGTYAIVQGG